MTSSPANQSLFSLLKSFDPISLDELNATMGLMERVETKYLVSFKDLTRILKSLTRYYFVLSIKNNSVFTYDNIYMDTSDYLFFQQHETGEKSRMKVRTRHYVDSNIAFFECKQKKGKLIRKGRYGIPVHQSLTMTDQSQSFFNGVCASLQLPYAEEKLQPSVRTLYQRITLCSKNNDERITIDFDLKLQDRSKPLASVITLPPIAIIETKSAHNKCRSHDILHELGYRATAACSKYCLAMLYTGKVLHTEKFKHTIKLIDSYNKPLRKIVQKRVDKTVRKLSGLKKIVPKAPLKTNLHIKEKLAHQKKFSA